MAIPTQKVPFGLPKYPTAKKDPVIEIRESEFNHVAAVLAEDVVGLAENSAAELIREAIRRDYGVQLKDGAYLIPMPQPPRGIRADSKLSVSFRVYFDIDDILKARTRKLRDKSEGARHLILETDIKKMEKKKNGKR